MMPSCRVRATVGAVAAHRAYWLRLRWSPCCSRVRRSFSTDRIRPVRDSLSLLTLRLRLSASASPLFAPARHRRSAVADAFVVLIALSRLKFDVTQLTLTFLDLLLIDPDTFSFLMTMHPGCEWQIALGVVLALPLLCWCVGSIRSASAGALALAGARRCAARHDRAVGRQSRSSRGSRSRASITSPISSRSGVAAVSHLAAAAAGWRRSRSRCSTAAMPRRSTRASRPSGGRTSSCCWTNRASTSRGAGIKVPDGYADSSSRPTARRARSWRRRPAGRPGTPNTTC